MSQTRTGGTKLNEVVEELLDDYGLSEVLYAISNMCAEKADHVLQFADSETISRNWKRAGDRVAAAAATGHVQAVSS
jgi:hypothetical protein